MYKRETITGLLDRSFLPPGIRSKTLQQALVLLLITGAAAFLRLYRLGDWSLWEDEAFTLSGKEDGFTYTFIRRSLTTNVIQQFTSRWGNDEWTARLIPALIGIATVPIFYFLLRRAFSRNIALLASASLAVSTWHLYWSQNARFYVSLLLFYTLASFFFYYGLEENKPRFLVFALIFFGLAMKERLLAAFFLPVVGLYIGFILLFRQPRPPGLTWRNLAIFFVPVGLTGLFFVGPYVRNLPGWFAGFWRINNDPLWLAGGVAYYAGIVTIGLALLAIVAAFRRRERAGMYFGLNAVVPVVVLMALSLIQYTANRYAFISLTSWILLASICLDAIWQSASLNMRKGALLLCITMFLIPLAQDLAYYQMQKGNRADWRAALQYMAAREVPGDLVFVEDPDVGRYYLHEPQKGFESFQIDRVAHQDRRVWFVGDLTSGGLSPEEFAWIKANAVQVASFDVHVAVRTFFMRVYLFTPPVTQ